MRILLCASTYTRKIIRPYRSAGRCFKHATKSIVALDAACPWANDTCGLRCLRACFCAHKHIRARSYVVIPQVGIAMGFLLQIRMSWLRALSKGCRCWCWCCGPGCWCCVLAERAFKTGGGAGRVLVSADCARCRKLAAQASYMLVPASRMSTGRGILPSLAIWVYAGVISIRMDVI